MKKLPWPILIAVLLAVVVLASPWWYPPVTSWLSLSANSSGYNIGTMGQFGDSFGVLTSIASTLTLIVLLYSYNVQKKREAQRDFENNFYNMLGVFDRLRDAINENWLHRSPPSYMKGREIFGSISIHLVSLLEDKKSIAIQLIANKREVENLEKQIKSIADSSLESKKEIIIKAYYIFYTLHKNALAHYFATLYNIISIIDSNSEIETEQKKKYVKILRATLSTYELNVLYYNSISPMGIKFQDYIKRYDLLDNIDFYSAISYKEVIPTIYPELQNSYEEYLRTGEPSSEQNSAVRIIARPERGYRR